MEKELKIEIELFLITTLIKKCNTKEQFKEYYEYIKSLLIKLDFENNPRYDKYFDV